MSYNHLLVSRGKQTENTSIHLGSTIIGGGQPAMIAGPCSVESYEQLRSVAALLKKTGVNVLRGGAFKPRTSPYDFQGLGLDGLKLLKEVADEFNLITISEIVDPRHLELAGDYIDVIQVGARNMHNFELLKEAGRLSTPILLKRGLSATLDEFLHAAEYILYGGNKNRHAYRKRYPHLRTGDAQYTRYFGGSIAQAGDASAGIGRCDAFHRPQRNYGALRQSCPCSRR